MASGSSTKFVTINVPKKERKDQGITIHGEVLGEEIIEIDNRKLILVKNDANSFSGDSDSDDEKLAFDGGVGKFMEVHNVVGNSGLGPGKLQQQQQQQQHFSINCQIQGRQILGHVIECEEEEEEESQANLGSDQQEKDRPFGCDICNKMFTRVEILRRHIKTHMEEKEFKCSYCPKLFDRRDVLNDHMRNHTGERPFQCTVCHKKFTRGFVLLRHMRTHAEGNYKCKYCRKSFDRKDTHRDHVRNHTGEKPYRCKYCNKSFSRSFVLTKHEKGHEVRENEQVDTLDREEMEEESEEDHTKTETVFVEELDYEKEDDRQATQILLRKEFPQEVIEDSVEIIEGEDEFSIMSSENLQSDTLISEEPVVEEVVETEAITLSTADGQIVRVISKQQYDRLLQAANKQKTYRCETCNRTFTSQTTFQHHFNLQWEAGGCITSK